MRSPNKEVTMRKFGIALIAGFALLISLLIIGYFITQPLYEHAYFTEPYLEKYRSPESTFRHYINSLRKADPSYYQEVLGRKISYKERLSLIRNPYKGKEPQIVKKFVRKNYVYIITDNNWGVNLEKVNGRWVFSPENISFLFRDLLRAFGF